MTRKQSIIVLAFSVLLFSFAGCKSSRKTVGQSYESSDRTAENVISESNPGLSVKQQVVKLVEGYNPWRDVSMSVRCKLRSPKSLNVSGKATMIRGEEIQISMRMLGFEVAGLYIDKDSAYVYEKLNRTMIVEPLSSLERLSGMTLSDIQDILLGQICYPGGSKGGEDLVKKFEIKDGSDVVTLVPRKSAIDWSYNLSKTDPLELLEVMVSLGAKGQAQCRYSAAYLTDAGPVSPSAQLMATAGKYKIDATIEWSLETASWNKGITAKNNIPKGYKRISLQQLLKALK